MPSTIIVFISRRRWSSNALERPAGAGRVSHQQAKKAQHHHRVHHPAEQPLVVAQQLQQQKYNDGDTGREGRGVATEEDEVPGPPPVVLYQWVAHAAAKPEPTQWCQAGVVGDTRRQDP